MSTLPQPFPLLRFVLLASLVIAVAGTAAARASEDETAESRYHTFASSLDTGAIAHSYPGAVKKLDANEPESQIEGLKTLAATGEIAAIPLVVARLDANDGGVRIWAGSALQRLVSAHALRRRDMSQGSRVVIKPPGPDDTDLRPLAWVIERMLQRPDDGNTHAYAATIIGYLDLRQFTGQLEALLESRHPAVQNAAKSALDMLGIDHPQRALGKEERAAARRTAESFGSVFLASDEDRFATLLLPERAMTTIFDPAAFGGSDAEAIHRAMVKANLTRFEELRSMLGDVSKFSVTGFEPGRPSRSAHYAAEVRSLKNSYVVLAYANRVIVRVKIEEMVFFDGECYIVEID